MNTKLARLLSKSDFKLAFSCPTKLYYKKNGYPSIADENEYLKYLADGGYAVGKMATLLYPEGRRIQNERGIEFAIEETNELLKNENITLFEPALLSNGKVAAVDILVKKGTHFELIEVKSKGFDSATPKFDRDWKKHFDDIAFQKLLLEELFPEAQVDCFLLVPDKAKRTSIDGLNALFEISKTESDRQFSNYTVTFKGNADDIRNDGLLEKINVNKNVGERIADVKKAIPALVESVQNNEKITVPLTTACFSCEFNTGLDKNGYRECWRDMPEPKHHIKDVYYLGTIVENKQKVANTLIAEKKLDLDFLPKKTFEGERGIRRRIQIENTKAQKEWLSEELMDKMESWQYPLHFVDFETCTTALPFHKNMRPYEMSAFQWSCHTIQSPGAEPTHSEWINLEPQFPSFAFAESLMNQIGNEGTPFMWSNHENTTLRNIHNQLSTYNHSNPALREWLQYVAKLHDDDEGTFIDMNALALKHYFHPEMKGRTSIKVTLPAVLTANVSERTEKWLSSFDDNTNLFHRDASGRIENPYKHLPPLDILEKAEMINEGTGAMRAYEDMLFGINKHNPEIKEACRQALLRYCKLDTLAMVIIWEHWSRMSKG